MDETMARKDGNSESEESFTDSGIPATEENATPSPDAAIMGQLEKVWNFLWRQSMWKWRLYKLLTKFIFFHSIQTRCHRLEGRPSRVKIRRMRKH